MAIKCIALDLDGTTLNREGKLSEGNRRALEYAIGRGVEVVIASGRPLVALPEDVCAVSGIRYAITSNGAAVYHIPSGECVRKLSMAEQSVREILRLSAGENIACEVFWNGVAYAAADYVRDPVRYGAPPQAVAYVQRTRKPVEDMSAFIDQHITDLDSMDLIVSDLEVKKRLWTLLEGKVKDIYITSSVSRLMEISSCDSGKHNAVRFIRELLGLAAAEVAAFGDGDNDAEMLEEAGVGYAMGNASKKCRAAADRATKHHDEDGVAEGIYELLKEEA